LEARRLTIIIGVALVGVCVFLLFDKPREEPPSTPHPNLRSHETDQRLDSGSEPDVAFKSSQVAGSNVQESRRLLPEAAALRVQATDGQPIGEAEARWTPVRSILLDSLWDWDELPPDLTGTETTRALTDQAGAATIDSPRTSAELGSVLWIDHPEYRPLLTTLDARTETLGGRTFELRPSSSIRVTVLGADGEPVAGAIVEQHGVELFEDADAPPYVAILFERTRTANASGIAFASRFPGRQALVASFSGQRSRPTLVNETRDVVTLRLHETFTASGTVPIPTAPNIGGNIVPRITLEAGRDNIWHELGTAKSNPDGSWGPIVAPWVGSDASYRAVVHGVAVITEHTPFGTPSIGEHVELHLDARAGLSQWFMAFDEEPDVPLLGATATVTWIQDGSLMAVSGKARPDGYILVMGVRPGPVHPILTKPGYRPGIIAGTILPEPTPTTMTCVLRKGRQVSGRVVRDGEPVADFDLSFWPGDEAKLQRTISVRDQPDGTFTIDGIGRGSWGLAASSVGSPGSKPLQIDIAEEDNGEIVVELLPARIGTGLVVHAEDGSPATEAVVQPYVSGGYGTLTPWGPPLTVQADGSFRGAAFREGVNRLVVSEPGRAQLVAVAETSGGTADFGHIRLERPANLRIVLEDVPEFDGYYRLTLESPMPISTMEFQRTPEGDLVATLDDVPVGTFQCELAHPNRDVTFRTVTLRSGDNQLRFRGGSGLLTASVPNPPEVPLELFIELDVGDSSEVYATDFDHEGNARMPRLPAGEALLFLRDGDASIATMSTTIRSGEETHVDFRLGDSDLLVRVVDPEDAPITGVALRLASVAEGDGERRHGTTNERGEFLFPSLTKKTYALSALHPTLGIRPATEVVVNTDEKRELEITLDGSAALELLVVDDDEPLAGVSCRLSDLQGGSRLPPSLTNAEGIARFPRLTPGGYRLRVEDGSIWPIKLDVDAQPGAGLRTVEARRLGDLVIRVVNDDGVAMNGVDLSLTDLETGELVSDWLADGRLVCESGDHLKTDKRGEVVLRGLPRGSYTWAFGEKNGVLAVVAKKETLVLVGG